MSRSMGKKRAYWIGGTATASLGVALVRLLAPELSEMAGSLAMASGSALVVAAAMTRTALKRPSSFLLGANLVIVGLSLIAIGEARSSWLLIIGSIGFGLADSAASIIYSATITQAVEDDMRATSVAANGAIRNLGKFAAPIGLGLVLLVTPMSTMFVVLGAAAVVVGLSARTLREFDRFAVGRAG